MFNPTSIDEVSIQATHLEARGKNGNPKFGGSSQPTASKKRRKENRNGKRKRQILYKKASPHALTVRRMGMMMSTAGFYMQR